MDEKRLRSKMLAGALSILTAPSVLAGDAHATPAEGTTRRSAPQDVLAGEWWTDNNEGRVRFSKEPDGTFKGVTTCCVPKVSTPDHPAFDLHNPNPKLRGRSTVGIVMIWNLTYGDGEYSDGYVYNPRDGKTYRFEVKVVDQNTVKIRGYMGIPLFGQTQVWKRVRPGEI